MTSSIQSFLPVTGSPDTLAPLFDGDPGSWLVDSRRDGSSDRWLVQLHAAALHRTVSMSVGTPWRAGSTHWRSLTWDPIGADGEGAPTDRLLPSFDGEMGLHLDERGQATLVLDGRYQPPGGRLGSAIDSIALRRLAQVTAGSFIRTVAAQLGAAAEADASAETDASAEVAAGPDADAWVGQEPRRRSM